MKTPPVPVDTIFQFQKGDHICTRTAWSHRRHHAVVVGVEMYQEKDKCVISIIEYTGRTDYVTHFGLIQLFSTSYGLNLIGRAGCTNGYVETNEIIGTDIDGWYKVTYDDGPSNWKGPKCFSPDEVCDRATYLLDNPDLVPEYSMDVSDSECFAVWCKTGVWYSKASFGRSILLGLWDVAHKVKLLSCMSAITSVTTVQLAPRSSSSGSSSSSFRGRIFRCRRDNNNNNNNNNCGMVESETTVTTVPYVSPLVFGTIIIGTAYLHLLSIWKTIEAQKIISKSLNISIDHEGGPDGKYR